MAIATIVASGEIVCLTLTKTAFLASSSLVLRSVRTFWAIASSSLPWSACFLEREIYYSKSFFSISRAGTCSAFARACESLLSS
jgi:hypothetical protein